MWLVSESCGASAGSGSGSGASSGCWMLGAGAGGEGSVTTRYGEYFKLDRNQICAHVVFYTLVLKKSKRNAGAPLYKSMVKTGMQ